ncbi:TnsD family Tn7-like transposition protein [Poseidonocella sp. HB161398]|uniref:TnsD family Tn7-like transposition protein n=1 Tax=Poseidonocella sp. HB161398 TaxID=2320855 RepID=UPI001109146F|nr:TnsD family Tn7-like transposition protein [Poseidonocella sp. HB161398]
MLTYFPAQLPDELLYSRLARYHRHSCSVSAKQTLDDLFGDRSVRASVDLQCHLRALSRRMPPTVREYPHALVRATLFGFHAAYQPKAIVDAARRAMIDGPAAGLHARLGIAAGLRLPPARLRWCPDCADEARARHGEAYWHRSHQLPGVLVCPDHGSALVAARMPEKHSQHDFVAASRETCVQPTDNPAEWREAGTDLLGEIARKAVRILDRPVRFADFAAIGLHCRSRLIEAGLAGPSGRIRIDRLTEAAGNALLPLQPIYPAAGRTDWLVAMGRKHRHAFSALQHILFDLVLEAAPPDPPRRKAAKPRRFLADDPAFERRLRVAAASAKGLRAAARAVGVDPRTIQRHAARLGIDGPWKNMETVAPAKPPDDLETDTKRRWQEAMESGLSRKALKCKFSADWTWLNRHHPEWLKENSPEFALRCAPGPRKDWAGMDSALAPSIGAAAETIRLRTPPARVTIAAIERELGREGWFLPRLKMLPLCKRQLASEKEPLETFRLRRVKWARETLLSHGHSARPWQIHRLSGLPQRVSRKISEALRGDTAP